VRKPSATAHAQARDRVANGNGHGAGRGAGETPPPRASHRNRRRVSPALVSAPPDTSTCVREARRSRRRVRQLRSASANARVDYADAGDGRRWDRGGSRSSRAPASAWLAAAPRPPRVVAATGRHQPPRSGGSRSRDRHRRGRKATRALSLVRVSSRCVWFVTIRGLHAPARVRRLSSVPPHGGDLARGGRSTWRDAGSRRHPHGGSARSHSWP